jgi:hypothetical protein
VLAEVLHRLLMTRQVLHHMPAMTARRHEGMPRPIGVLPKIKAMVLLVSQPRVTLMLPKATTMRCDEGSQA